MADETRRGGGPGPGPGHAEADAGLGPGELAAVERLRRRLPAPGPGEIWIGDDAAVLVRPPDALVLTTDLTVAGVHGDLALIGLDDLGWRALARAVSDVAAMGAVADAVVVAVAGPPTTNLELLYDGLAAAADAHRCPVVGGDLSGAPELVVAVTAYGHMGPGPGPVRRDGARPGDDLFVTGPFGGAAAGLRSLAGARARGRPVLRPDPDAGDPRRAEMAHRRPRARLEEGDVARRSGATAMIDVSDGLLLDLFRLADASGVGFALEDVPVFATATLDDALGGGDDYELVIATAEAAALVGAFTDAGLRPPCHVGVVVAERARRTLDGRDVEPTGWEHTWD